MFKEAYRLIMDDEENAFNKLPKIVRFQLMTTLAYMWCIIFSLGVGSYVFFGTSVVFHILFLLGLFFTSDLFRKADQNQKDHLMVLRDKKDGGALYDDIWGGV